MADVFISYSRKDKEFVSILYDAFERNQKKTWVDWKNIPLTSDWWAEIEKGIEAADTFVFVISPDSIASEVCAKEILHAVQNNKRLFPIVRRDTTNFEAGNLAHDAIKKHNWLMFREQDDFEAAFQTLTETISLDLEHLHRHTRLLVRAIEWGHGRSDSLLLRGDDLTNAEQWLAESEGKNPQPTELQETYIKNSRDVEDASHRAIAILKDAERKAKSRIKVGAIVLAGALILAAAVSVWAKNSIEEANKKTKDANKAVATADITLSKTASEIDFLQDRSFESLLNAMRASYKLKKAEAELGGSLDIKRSDVLPILSKTIYENPAINILEGHSDRIESAKFSQDGTKILTVSRDKTAKIWDLKGQVLKTVNKHIDKPYETEFNKQGDRLITISQNKVLKILDIEGNVIKEVKDIGRAEFSGDDSKIIAYPDLNKQSVMVLDLQGKLIHDFKLLEDFNSDYYYSLSVSFDATKLIYPTKYNTVKILDRQNNIILEIPDTSRAYFNEDSSKVIVYSDDSSPDKKKQRIFDLQGDRQPLELNREEIKSFALNRDGSKILTLTTVSKDDDQKVKLSNFKDNQINETLVEFKVKDIYSVSFSRDFTKISTYSNDDKIQIWDLKGNYITEVKNNSNEYLIIFNRDYSKFVTIDGNKVSDGNKVRLSDILNKFITIQGYTYWNFSRDSNRILTRLGDEDRQTVQLLDLQGNPIGEPLKLKSNSEYGYINNDFKKIVLRDNNAKTSRIFDFSGKLNADVEGVDPKFNKDGSRIATRLGNKILLWDAQGNRMGSEIETGLSESELLSMNFSSDGSKLIVIAEQELQIWDLESRQKVTKDTKRGFSNNYIDFSNSSNYSNIVITVDANDLVKCWDLKGNLIKEINVKLTDNDYVRFSNDGKYFLTTSGENNNKKVQIWDMQGNLVSSPKQDSGGISKAEFSFDGQKLITYSKDNIVRIWDMAGNLTTKLKGHTDTVNNVKLSVDGSKIVTASEGDKTIRVWDATGNPIGIINSPPSTSFFYSAEFSADGSKIVAFAFVPISRDAVGPKILIYDNKFATNEEQLWQLGCKKLADYLTYNPKATEEDKKMCGIVAGGM